MSESELSCDTPFIGRNETLDLSLYQVYKIRQIAGVYVLLEGGAAKAQTEHRVCGAPLS